MKTKQRSLFIAIILLLLATISYSQIRRVDVESRGLRWEIQSLPALGFFPLGGNTIDKSNVATYITGSSFDILAFDLNEKSRPENFGERISPINISAYLLGLNFTALRPNSEAKFFNIGYIRIGPRFRSYGYKANGAYALGGQFGYGLLIQGNTENATSNIQHGIDISITFTWTPYWHYDDSSGHYGW